MVMHWISNPLMKVRFFPSAPLFERQNDMDNFTKSTLLMFLIIALLIGYVFGFKIGIDKGAEEASSLCYEESLDADLEFLKIERMIDLFFDKAVEFKNATGG